MTSVLHGLRQQLQVARSLATGAVVAVRRNDDIRLLPLDYPQPGQTTAVPDIAIGALSRRMVDGDVTSAQLTGHFIGQIMAQEPRLHTLISVNPDAMQQARDADARRSAGESGPLLGIPVMIKDNIETAGMPTTGGAEILSEHQAGRDASLVSLLRDAGAVILGKNNLSELAGAVVRTPGFSAVGGQTVNPSGESYSSGGSSSGSAASVAAGLTVVSVGTETAGSLIAPAAFCGLVAVKPSRGLVDGTGVIPLIRFQDTPGPLARTVADAAVLLEVLSRGTVAAEIGATLHGVRVGLLKHDIRAQTKGLEDVSDAEAILTRIEARLRRAGATVAAVELAGDTSVASMDSRLLPVVFAGLAHDTIGYLSSIGAPVDSLAALQAYNLREPRRRMPAGQALLSLAAAKTVTRATYEKQAMDLRKVTAQVLDETLRVAGADLLVSLSNIHSAVYATAGYPAVTIPGGVRTSGMPTGITLIGPLGSDAWLMGMAAALEGVE